MRAFSQLRCTVRSDTLRETAISTNRNPQKSFRSITSAETGCQFAKFVQGIADLREILVVYGVVRRIRVQCRNLETDLHASGRGVSVHGR